MLFGQHITLYFKIPFKDNLHANARNKLSIRLYWLTEFSFSNNVIQSTNRGDYFLPSASNDRPHNYNFGPLKEKTKLSSPGSCIDLHVAEQLI